MLPRALSYTSRTVLKSKFLSQQCRYFCICFFLISVLSCHSEAENSASHQMRIRNVKLPSHSNKVVIGTLDVQERRRAANDSLSNTFNDAQGLYNNVTGTLNSAQQLYNNATSIYNKTKSTIDDTVSTPPSQWSKSQWIIVGIALAVLLCCFGCIWRCIPCAPRII